MTKSNNSNSVKAVSVKAVSVKAESAKAKAMRLAAEMAQAEAAEQAAQQAADAAEAVRIANEEAAKLLVATLIAEPTATPAKPVVVTVAKDVFGNRVSSLRCRGVNKAILACGADGAKFKMGTLTKAVIATAENDKHVSEFGKGISAISNHLRSVIIDGHVVVDAETGLYMLSEAMLTKLNAGEAK